MLLIVLTKLPCSHVIEALLPSTIAIPALCLASINTYIQANVCHIECSPAKGNSTRLAYRLACPALSHLKSPEKGMPFVRPPSGTHLHPSSHHRLPLPRDLPVAAASPPLPSFARPALLDHSQCPHILGSPVHDTHILSTLSALQWPGYCQ